MGEAEIEELGTPHCPRCEEAIAADQINMKEGMALCSKCGTMSQIALLEYDEGPDCSTLRQVPSGCAVVREGRSVVVTASLRSWTRLLPALGVAVFWNGVVSIFLSLFLSAVYYQLFGPVPDWFPVMGLKNGVPEMNGGPMGVGMTVFLGLFLTPFVAIGTMLLLNALLTLAGSNRIVIDEMGCKVSTGIGPLRWTRSFEAEDVTSVHVGETRWRNKGASSGQPLVEISADRDIRFGSQLTHDRMTWLIAALWAMLVKRDRVGDRAVLPELPWLKPRSSNKAR